MPEHLFAYYESAIGVLKITANANAITEITFLNEEVEIQKNDVATSAILTAAIAEIAAYFNGDLQTFTFAYGQAGTSFQQSVWQSLLTIPYGKTISYLQLAKALNNPKVIRAAASTNGKNKLAIVVPCHRVIGSNNSLVGYAGGLWRKRWLLEHEQKYSGGLLTLF